ncbi:MAG TPA: hypothetical protein VNJ71_06375 [Gemmatimonadales bacterium]|nr:hypothetical protein [Gemmatimonadales bacterium]
MRPWLAVAAALGVLAWGPDRARAQDSLRVAPDSGVAVPARDSLAPRPPLSPMGGFWRSLLLPGWGQARLDRKLTGALFVAWEGVTLGMTLKVSHELSHLEHTGSSRVGAKRKERQDWLVLLAFNHLFSAIEAYVSTHLWDFPPDLQVHALPDGLGAGVRIPVRIP